MQTHQILAVAVLFMGCSGPATQPTTPATSTVLPASEPPEPVATVAPADISVVAVRSVAAIRALPVLEPGQFRVHMIDVGTGLSFLVQGSDFNLLYDAGSNDDFRGVSSTKSNSRVVAYLWAALGESGPKECKPAGDTWPVWAGEEEKAISHVVLSHPHKDHGILLDDVLKCFKAENVWDTGVINDTQFYQEWWQAISEEAGVEVHTVADVWADRTANIHGKSITVEHAPWSQIDEGQVVELGAEARFKVLHADAGAHHDPNQNTLVLRVDLGSTSLLLTGDAESGGREAPSKPVGDIEKHLLENFARDIDVDILQVGHHGSLTSSRMGFLLAVSPKMALLSTGPTKYGSIVLPDQAVIDALVEVGATVYSTDEHDKTGCPVVDRVGSQEKAGTAKERPGGCDNYVLNIR